MFFSLTIVVSTGINMLQQSIRFIKKNILFSLQSFSAVHLLRLQFFYPFTDLLLLISHTLFLGNSKFSFFIFPFSAMTASPSSSTVHFTAIPIFIVPKITFRSTVKTLLK